MSWQELPLSRIYYDATRGVPGTAWPIGTPGVPSNTIADVITMLAARNLKAVDVHGAVTLAVDLNHKDFFGNYHESLADIVTLGAGNNVSNSRFENLVITGAQGGTAFATYKECLLLNMTGFRGLAENCAIYGDLAVDVGADGFADFDRCTSVHGEITVTIGAPNRVSFKEFSGGLILADQTDGAVLVRGISGYLEVDNMDGGTLDIYAHGADIQIDADCGGGEINIYGDARVTIVGAPTATIHDYTIESMADPKVMGRAQIAATTIDLDLGIGTHDLFTGTAQAVILESLNIKLPTGTPGGTLTSISIQTDDATQGVIISAETGAVANLLTEADLGWTGTLYITVDTKIQLSILGGPSVADYICKVTAKCRAVVSGGYLE